MTEMPSWMSKHPCTGCNIGYGACAQFATVSLQCCKDCKHPTRWEANPWTREEFIEMWTGKDMPEATKKFLETL